MGIKVGINLKNFLNENILIIFSINNVFNKNVYAADDYYFFANTSIGVKSTYRLTDEINGPWFHTPWSRGLTKFEPQGK